MGGRKKVGDLRLFGDISNESSIVAKFGCLFLRDFAFELGYLEKDVLIFVF
jgi:hypothetical protein